MTPRSSQPAAALSVRLVPTALGPIEIADTGPVVSDPPGAAGTRPVVLGVHGLIGDWRQARILTLLADEARVLLLSRPGYGRTPLGRHGAPEAQADLYAALLDALSIPRAVVFGVSAGGPSSFAFAARHRDRCQGLVLVSAVATHLMAVPAGLRLAAALPPLHEAALRITRRQARRVAHDPAAFADFLAHELTPSERAALDGLGRALLAEFADARVEGLRGGRGIRADARALLRTFGAAPAPWPPGPDIPAEVLHGVPDTVVSVKQARHYAATIPGARLTVLDDAGHALLVSHHDLVLGAVRRVLAAGPA